MIDTTSRTMRRGTAEGGRRGRWRTRTRAALAACLGLLAGAATGCGNLTSGGFGEVEVVVASDEVAAIALQGLWDGLEAGITEQELEGHLQLRLRAFVRSEAGAWIELTEGSQEVQLDLQHPEPQEVARRELREGSYPRARILFSHVEAVITQGLVVDGDTITGPVRVDLGLEGRIEVQTPLALEVRSGGTSALLLDMKTERWLRRLDIAACRSMDCLVREEEFQEEVRIRTRQP